MRSNLDALCSPDVKSGRKEEVRPRSLNNIIMMEAHHEFIPPPEEKLRTETEKKPEKRGLSDYEKFWVDLERGNSADYLRHWTRERRKSFLEDGAEFLVDARDQGIQTMVFMDKSARPLALFLRALWRRIYADQDPPAMRFAVGKRESNMERGAGDQLAGQISGLYRKKDFNEKNVLFVDEEVASGETLKQTSNLFKRVFPNMRVNLGALSTTNQDVVEKYLTIKPPQGSRYKALFNQQYPSNLAQVIHSSKDRHRQTEVEEQPDSILAKAQKMPQSKKWTYRLMLVGKHQTLDEKSLEGIDDRMQEAKTEAEKERLQKIREAYEKLLPRE